MKEKFCKLTLAVAVASVVFVPGQASVAYASSGQIATGGGLATPDQTSVSPEPTTALPGTGFDVLPLPEQVDILANELAERCGLLADNPESATNGICDLISNRAAGSDQTT